MSIYDLPNHAPMVGRYPDFDGSQPCAGVDIDVYFPKGDCNTTALAKSLCKSCPFVLECLEFALANKAQGIWGGTTTEERKAMSANAVREAYQSRRRHNEQARRARIRANAGTVGALA